MGLREADESMSPSRIPPGFGLACLGNLYSSTLLSAVWMAINWPSAILTHDAAMTKELYNPPTIRESRDPLLAGLPLLVFAEQNV